MLKPENTLHKLLALVLFRLPHNQRRWQACLHQYRPLLEDAFKYNYAARLLVMKALRQIDANDIDGAQNTIAALRPSFAAADHPSELALWHILHALHQCRSGHTRRMGANLRSAAKYNHRFHLAYLLYAEYLYRERRYYDEAEIQYTNAIDSLYAYPPMTDDMRRIMGNAYSGIANARIMMHRYDEARDALRIAEQMVASQERLLYSQALLNAVLQQPTEANRCLNKLADVNPDIAAELRPEVERILANQHPQFSITTSSTPELLATFWQFFLQSEEQMVSLLRMDRRPEASHMLLGHLAAIDPNEQERLLYDIRMEGDEFQFILHARYSDTDNALLDQLFAACPPELHERWHIIREP